MEKQSGIISFDRLCKILGVDDLETVMERIMLSDFPAEWTDKEVEAYQDEETSKYIWAVVSVAEDLFSKHGMELTELKTKHLNYRILPCFTHIIGPGWKGVCEVLVRTINGVGYFHFRDAEELKDHGPYSTYRQAALHHIGWVADYSRVYEGGTARNMVDRRLR